MIKTNYFLLYLLFLCSCGTFIVPETSQDAVSVFEHYWKDFDRYYPFFTYKGIDWDSVYHEYRPRLSEQSSEEELWNVLAEITESFHDGHTALYSPFGVAATPRFSNEGFNVDIIMEQYIDPLLPHGNSGLVFYGSLNNDLGYIRYKTFIGNYTEFDGVDSILTVLGDIRGLVVDVRNNNGGNDNNWKPLTNRLINTKLLYRYSTFRNGPGHDDFSEPTPEYIEPSRDSILTIPVLLLTNRRTPSAAEGLAFVIKAWPQAKIMGDNTRGSIAGPTTRDLPNGWVYMMSAKLNLTYDGRIVAVTGLAPDIKVLFPKDNKPPDVDPVMDRAIAYFDSLFLM